MDIKQLRELEAKATRAPWSETSDSFDFNISGPKGENIATSPSAMGSSQTGEFSTCDDAATNSPFIVALRNAAPYLFAVVEAAEGLEDHQDNFCECHLLTGGHLCPICTLLSALSDFRNAK